MKKKILAFAACSVLVFSLAGCGTSETDETTTVEESEENSTDKKAEEPADGELSIIENIQADFNETIGEIEDELETVYTNVGDTYDEYAQNKSIISDWYTTCLTETEQLFDRTYDASIEYYKYVADTVDHDDYDAVDDALQDFYDEIIDESFNSFYDGIIDGDINDIYDKYDKIINDADEWDTWSDMFDEWNDAWSDMSNEWNDAWSDTYDLWDDVWNAFAIDQNFDVDAIIESSGEKDEVTNGAEQGEEELDESEQVNEEMSNESAGEAFIASFNTDPVIEETVLWDEQKIKVTATSLTYTSWSADLNLTLENNSDKTLSFIAGTMAFPWNSVNGYTVSDGYLNEELEPGATEEATISFSTTELSILGINEIADITFAIELEDEDYNTTKLAAQKLETSIASSYDYETDTYQEILKNGQFEKIGNCIIDYVAFDQLYSNNGISLVSEALIESKDEDNDLLGLLLEVVNDSDNNIYAVISDVSINDVLVYDSIWTNETLFTGKKSILELDLNDIVDRTSMDDIDENLLESSVDSVSFTLSIRNENYEDALTPQEITIDLK